MLFVNIRLMLRKHFALFVVLILTQIISTVLVLFTFGVYQNTLYEKMAITDKTKTISFIFNKKDAIEAIRKIKEAFPEESLKLNESLTAIRIWSVLDEKQSKQLLEENGIYDNKELLSQIGGRIDVNSKPFFVNGKYDGSGWKNDIYAEPVVVENWFEDEDYLAGSNKCIICNFLNIETGGSVSIGGVGYKVKYCDETVAPSLYFCPEDYPEIPTGRFQLTLYYKKQLLRSEYERDVNEIDGLFGMEGIKVDDFVTIDIENKATWKSKMLISVLMGLAATFIICLIYYFLHKERQKNLAIYELCGCTKPHAALVFIAESFIYLAVSVALGLLIYKTIVIKKASVYYLWIKEISSTENIVKLMGGFVPVVIIAIVVTVLLSVRKTPREVLKAKE